MIAFCSLIASHPPTHPLTHPPTHPSAGPAGAVLGAKLSDYQLMMWLLTAVGADKVVDRAGRQLPLDCRLNHTRDGWEGVNLRRVCG